MSGRRPSPWSLLPRAGVLAAMLVALAASAAAEARVVDLAIRDGELPKAHRVVRVHQGDDVALRWTSNTSLAIHLHGYDLEQTVSAEHPVTMRFTARATGRFPIEVHAHGQGKERVLGYLEVHPR